MTMTHKRPYIYVLVLLLSVPLLGGLTACTGPSEEAADVDREELRAVLLEYLPKMGEAYFTGDLNTVRPYISEREVAVLQKNIRDLARQGRTVKTTLKELTIEDVNVLSYATVSVTTVEEWSVEVYAQGTTNLLAEDESQVNRVQYQLGRDDGEWTVMGRNSQTLQD